MRTFARRTKGSSLLARDLALDETVGTRLGSKHLGVLAGVLEALVPAEVCFGCVSVCFEITRIG